MRVFDYEGELTADYRAAVAAALPADICPLPEFWRRLAEAIQGYIGMTENRTRRPPKGELERWRNVAALVDALGVELRKIRRDPVWGDRCARALSALTPIKDMAAAHIAGYETLADPKLTKGHSNPPRQFLYSVVLDLWRRLGQDLRYSRSGIKGKPGGPLIRFFDAVVRPVLGDDAPGVHGIADIIDRARARRGGASSRSEK